MNNICSLIFIIITQNQTDLITMPQKMVLTTVKYPQPRGEVSPQWQKNPREVCLQLLLSHYEEVTNQGVLGNISVINAYSHLWHLWVLLTHPCMKDTTAKSQKKLLSYLP